LKKTACIIPTFNMPERTDALAEYIDKNCQDVEIIIVDNGSSFEHRSVHAKVLLADNVQTTHAWLMGMHYADALERKYKGSFFAYWNIITSAEFTVESLDPLAPMVEFLSKSYDAVGVHPALTDDSTTSWNHMKSRDWLAYGFRQTWMIDNIASLWRADWFNSIGRFDPRLTYAWGIDLETAYKARSAGKTLWICDEVKVKKVTDIGYKMGRMGMSAEERKERARFEMNEVFTEKYGPNWRSVMYVED